MTTSSRPNLLLIGLRASGKSTLARALADRRGTESIDLDDHVLRRMGHSSVADAWKAEGEGAFRRAETESLREALQGQGRVIALGGGTPTAPGAADVIREAQRNGTALVVYLRCTPDELARRLDLLAASTDRDRPSLTGADPVAEVETIFAGRDPLYRELADHVVENVQTVDQALGLIGPLW